MRSQRKTKGQLINQLNKPPQRIIEQDRLEDRRKQAEEVLRKNENYHRTLLENLPQKIFLKDKNSVYLFCNENYSRDLKIRPDEIMGKTDYDFYPEELAKKYRTDDKRIMESGKTVDIEERYIQEGKEVIVHTVKTPIKDEKGRIVGILGIFWDITERKHADDELKKYRERLEELVEERTDELRNANKQLQREITERKRAEKALRESERRYRTLFEGSRDAIYITSREGEILDANHSMLDLFGYSREEMLGLNARKAYVYPEDRMKFQQEIERNGFVRDYEMKLRKRDGTEMDCLLTADVRHADDGSILGYQGIIRDITELKQIVNELHTETQRFQTLSENAPFGMVMIDKDGTFRYMNPKFRELFGYDLNDVPDGRTWFRKAYPNPTYRHNVISTWINDSESFKPGEKRSRTFTVTCKEGTEKIINFISVQLETGEYLMTCGDITDRVRSEESIRESEEKYRNLVERANDGIAIIRDGILQYANLRLAKIGDYTIDELIGTSFVDHLDPEEVPKLADRYKRRMAGKDVIPIYETALRRKDGSRIEVEVNAGIITYQGKPADLVVVRDVSERKRGEEALRESEKRYRALFEGSRDAIYITAREGEIVDANQSMIDLFGYRREEIIGLNARKTYVYPEDRKKFQHEIEREGYVRDYEIKLRKKDGTEMVCLLTATVRRANGGKIVGYQGILRDITEHNQVLNELHTEKHRFQTLSENAPFGMVMIDKEGAFRYINPKFRELFGYDLNDVPNGKTWFRKAYPQASYRHDVISTWINDLESSNPGEKRSRTFTVTCQDGTEKIIHFIPVQLDTGENLMACEDITERKRTEIEMAALQEQLRQSQKMEAIGRLAGGIAHDFNNLLTVIRGYSQLLLVEHKEGTSLEENIEQIKQAADRAADLTRQLLAFSRRQLMEMRVLDLNTVLRNLDKMLRRVLGEDVKLVTLLAEDLGRVKTDPGQMEQVVMNLAVNARDAMPSGGRLTIETANVELDEAYARAHISVPPGRYVMLSVSDTGVGMTPEVRERVFEPFFTTKEKGKGTGLGLSTVYGIVKQSGGNIWVYSEPGKGTTFKIYLQRVDEPLEELREKMLGEELPRGKETVLVVEDDEKVRKLIVEILGRQGYRVLEASHGEEALLIHEKHDGPMHLVLVDVVMPGMSGSELAKRLASLHPETKILYMSGYTDNAIVHHGVLARGVNYIQKPFTVDGLARKVREVLDKDSKPAG